MEGDQLKDQDRLEEGDRLKDQDRLEEGGVVVLDAVKWEGVQIILKVDFWVLDVN